MAANVLSHCECALCIKLLEFYRLNLYITLQIIQMIVIESISFSGWLNRCLLHHCTETMLQRVHIKPYPLFQRDES